MRVQPLSGTTHCHEPPLLATACGQMLAQGFELHRRGIGGAAK